MRAVRVVHGAVSTVTVAPPSDVGEGVRVRVAAAGICGTDLHLIDAGLTVTLGHEFAGWLSDGTPVAVEPLAPCAQCGPCLAGDYQRCVDGMAMVFGIGRDGGMAESCMVAPSSIVPLPAGVEPRDACLVEPLAVAVHAVRRARVTAADRVVVVGAGSVGLCSVVAARAIGAHVDVRARHDHQRAAAERLGAGVASDDGYGVVIDAAGTLASFNESAALAGSGGRIVMLAAFAEPIPASALGMKEIDLLPSLGYGRVGPSRDIDVAAFLMARTPELASTLITHRFPLDAASDAFAAARDRASGAIKVVIEP